MKKKDMLNAVLLLVVSLMVIISGVFSGILDIEQKTVNNQSDTFVVLDYSIVVRDIEGEKESSAFMRFFWLLAIVSTLISKDIKEESRIFAIILNILSIFCFITVYFSAVLMNNVFFMFLILDVLYLVLVILFYIRKKNTFMCRLFFFLVFLVALIPFVLEIV